MKAIRIHGRGGADHLVYEDAPKPEPGSGDVLVRVYATGVIATELTWDETYRTRTGSQRAYPIPGHDFSGVVEEVGADVTHLAKGDEIYALIDFDRDGAADEARIFDVRPIWFVVRPNHDQLSRIASVIDEGYVRPIIDTVLPLSQARQAYEYGAKGHTRGKIVLQVVE